MIVRNIFKITALKEKIMNDEIVKAKKLLIENGYIIKKWTHSMELEMQMNVKKWKRKGYQKIVVVVFVLYV